MAAQLTPLLTPITPKELYLQRVRGTYEQIRAESSGLEYYPPDFGGLFNQRNVLSQDVVLELIEITPE